MMREDGWMMCERRSGMGEAKLSAEEADGRCAILCLGAFSPAPSRRRRQHLAMDPEDELQAASRAKRFATPSHAWTKPGVWTGGGAVRPSGQRIDGTCSVVHRGPATRKGRDRRFHLDARPSLHSRAYKTGYVVRRAASVGQSCPCTCGMGAACPVQCPKGEGRADGLVEVFKDGEHCACVPTWTPR